MTRRTRREGAEEEEEEEDVEQRRWRAEVVRKRDGFQTEMSKIKTTRRSRKMPGVVSLVNTELCAPHFLVIVCSWLSRYPSEFNEI